MRGRVQILCLAALLFNATAGHALPGTTAPGATASIAMALVPEKPKDARDPPVDAQPGTEPGPDPDPGPGGEPDPADPGPEGPDTEPQGVLQLCAADLDGDGDATGPGETASCAETTGGGFLCPLSQFACVPSETGSYRCPAGDAYPCHQPLGGGAPACSPHLCASLAVAPIVELPPIGDAGASPDGAVDADGNCLGTVEIFGGRGVRCRTAGIATSFSNCCRNKGEIVRDGVGSSIDTIATKIAVAKGVFQGMSAAFAAFRAGATTSQAASAGANALVVGLDPTSIAISLAINFMVELLFSGCDQQDMEVGMLKGSGMCHEVGSYCTASFLGLCLQRAYGQCCFNTKLGRIIHEQGRPQLKTFNATGWGTPQQPLCRGFTPEEFQALDFSRMDLSDYFADIEARAVSQIQIDMKERVDAYLDAVAR